MFQFRAFPSYAYFIQRTIPEYCSGGFPHSEISGSTDICSSPKLIAACHVLLRLLMPRHSPCALYSLTKEIQLVLLNYAGNQQVTSQNCNCYPHLFRCSTIKIHNFSSTFVETFCCLAFITFQYIVQFSRCNYSGFEARSQNLISQILRSNGKIGTGGPEWARTTDLTIISRTL